MERTQDASIRSDDRAAALYHVVYSHEGFEDSAQALFKLVQRAQELQPGKKRTHGVIAVNGYSDSRRRNTNQAFRTFNHRLRILYLDIQGHRNHHGGFDADMEELQNAFLFGVLARFVTEIHCPLVSAKNPHAQDNDIPPRLLVLDQR